MVVCGEVIALNNDTARIKTARPASCEGCANAGVCGTKNMEISAMNHIGSKVGDRVMVEYKKSAYALLLLTYVFICPVIILFLSIWAATVYPWYFLIGLPLAIVYYLGLKFFNKHFKPSSEVIEIIKDEENGES